MVLAALVEVMSASLLWLLDALVEMLAAVVEMLAASVLCAADNSDVAAVPVLAMLAASALCAVDSSNVVLAALVEILPGFRRVDRGKSRDRRGFRGPHARELALQRVLLALQRVPLALLGPHVLSEPAHGGLVDYVSRAVIAVAVAVAVAAVAVIVMVTNRALQSGLPCAGTKVPAGMPANAQSWRLPLHRLRCCLADSACAARRAEGDATGPSVRKTLLAKNLTGFATIFFYI